MPRWFVVCLVGTGALVALVALAAGVLFAGVYTPAARHDRDTEAALFAIAKTLHERYGRERKPLLPPSLPGSGTVEYRNLGAGSYQLCATFEQEREGGIGTWAHTKGRNCFQFSVYDRPWVDPSTRRWIFPTC